MIVALLLTGKRGPLVFFLISFVFVELWSSDNLKLILKKMGKYILILLISVFIIYLYINLNDNGIESRNTIIRFLEMFNNLGENDVSNGRFELWNLALKTFINNPIFGSGWNEFHNIAFAYLGEDIQTHNIYLQLLSELGFTGFLLYMVPIIYCFIDTKKQFRIEKNTKHYEESVFMKISLFLQIFLFLYGMTGNTIYDYNVLLIYFFAFTIYCNIKFKVKNSSSLKNHKNNV
ncbi:MAG: O-antigen ligase family protein [Erysipelotrichaceae bacterium]|nr:O-antigen ligase family protein [Erysipelotrichaceae bacterium]